MRLVSFLYRQQKEIGVQVDDHVLVIGRANTALPPDMKSLLVLGEAAMQQVGLLVEKAKEEWLVSLTEVQLLPPVPDPEKILCIGHNYQGHIGIGKTELPEYPNLFCKTANTLIGDGQAILLPQASQQVDYEAELMAVIGKPLYNVTEEEAASAIAGYTLFNDVSARDYQKRTSQWMLGKCFDTFGPMGPALVTPDEISDLYALELSLTVNGELAQQTNTRNMIFSVPYLISYISRCMTLLPGDCIATGTPAKLPQAAEQKRFLQDGDRVEMRIEKLGVLCNPVKTRLGMEGEE